MTAPAQLGPSPSGDGPVPFLTDCQWRVLRLLAEGRTGLQVARELGVSPVTVRGYSHRIQEALSANTVAHAVHLAHQLGMLDDLPRRQRSVVPPAQVEVLRMVAAGLSNSKIAAVLGRSEYVVAEQVRQARHRLGAGDRSHAVALAMAAGLIRPEDINAA